MKIQNYVQDNTVSIYDKLVGTDANDSSKTKSYEIGSVLGLLGNITQGPQGPQGSTGPTGPQGPVGPAGLNWQGTWVSGDSYVLDDAVAYNGASWFCIVATSGTTTPNLDTTHWALLASQGAIGPVGPAGPTGPQGPAGTATLNYKVYRASLSFDSGGITVITHENNLGGPLTWSYTSGYVSCISSSLFTSGKTFATSTTYFGSGTICSFNPFIQNTSLINYASRKTSDNSAFIPYSSAIINVEILVYY